MAVVGRIRLIVSDLDGTLLDPSGAVSERTRRAVASAHALGVPTILATSRRLIGALPVARALSGVEGLILYDGAQVRAYPSGDVLLACQLAPEIAQWAAETLAASGLQPIAQHSDATGERLIVGPRPGRGRWADTYLASMAAQVERVSLAEVGAGRPGPLRLVAFGPPGRLRAAARVLASGPASGERISGPASPGAGFATQILPLGSYGTAELTIFVPSASKGAAVTHLAELREIPLARVLALGDGVNDISMLRAAGLAVAMETAPRVVRRAAHVVTTSNAEDGAARAIERYVAERDAFESDTFASDADGPGDSTGIGPGDDSTLARAAHVTPIDTRSARLE
jgi:hypothetical protein